MTDNLNPVILTDSAALAVKRFIDEDERRDTELHLQVMVVGGGCAGFEYDLGLAEAEDDFIQYREKDVPMLVDPISLPYLQGCVIDYSDGLSGKGFTVSNPNASSGCGCGKSFNVEEDTLDESQDTACGGCPSAQ